MRPTLNANKPDPHTTEYAQLPKKVLQAYTFCGFFMCAVYVHRNLRLTPTLSPQSQFLSKPTIHRSNATTEEVVFVGAYLQKPVLVLSRISQWFRQARIHRQCQGLQLGAERGCIGVARIFSGVGCTFFLTKNLVMTFFQSSPSLTWSYTSYTATNYLFISSTGEHLTQFSLIFASLQKMPRKIFLFLAMGVHLNPLHPPLATPMRG